MVAAGRIFCSPSCRLSAGLDVAQIAKRTDERQEAETASRGWRELLVYLSPR